MTSEPKYGIGTPLQLRGSSIRGAAVDIANGTVRGWSEKWYYLLSIHMGRNGRRSHWFRESEVISEDEPKKS
jgi:hypothetical protein